MLNRLNELDYISSYSGNFCLNSQEVLPDKHDTGGKSLLIDKNLELKLNLKTGYNGHKPECADMNGIRVLFWGEVYNFDELIEKVEFSGEKKNLSFSCLCCFLYRKYGFAFLKLVNGMFSFILRDESKDLFILAVDRFGSPRPIYYSLSTQLQFSSHLKLLLSEKGIAREIDKKSLAIFLKYSYIPSPRSMVKGIKKLGPGEMIICHKGACRIERYLDFEKKIIKMPIDEAAHQYTELLRKSLSRRLQTREEQKIGILLSGGLDSSANVALTSSLDKFKFETFGIGFNNPDIDERPYARIVADHFNVPFHDYIFTGNEIEDLPEILWNLEEPFIENGLFLTYAGFKSAQNQADIIISGNCTDQLFGTGGFAGSKPIALRYLLDKMSCLSLLNKAKKVTELPMFYNDNILFKLKVLLRRATSFNDWFFWGFDSPELKKLCRFDISLADFDIFPDSLKAAGSSFDDYYQHSVIHQDIEHYACQNVLVKSYRISEMTGVLGRDPYLDYDVVDFILGLELQLKRKGRLSDYFQNSTKSKYLHRIAMRNLLPQSILNKPKQGGFVSMALLLSDHSKRVLIFNYILNSNIVKEYLNIEFVRKLFAEYNYLNHKKVYWVDHRDHMAGKIIYLLVLALWHDMFIDNCFSEIKDRKLSEILNSK